MRMGLRRAGEGGDDKGGGEKMRGNFHDGIIPQSEAKLGLL
jgi:hypothetical protein